MAPTPAPSTFPPTPVPSHMNWTISELVTPAPSLVDVATPSRRVVATALRPPLQMSHSVLEFRLPSGYFELGIESGAGRAQVCQSSTCWFSSILATNEKDLLFFVRRSVNSPLSHGGHIVPGDQKSFVLPR